MDPKPDRTTVLAVRVVLGLTVWLTIANTIFQALQIPYKDPWVFVTLCTGVVGAVVYTTYDRQRKAICATPLNILMVEDSPTQAAIFKVWMSKNSPQHKLTFAASVEQALDMLRNKPPFELFSMPDVILLDLGFPQNQLQGPHLIKVLKEDRRFDDVHVIILTARDKEEYGYNNLQCSAWVEKGQGLTAITKALEDTTQKLIEKRNN